MKLKLLIYSLAPAGLLVLSACGSGGGAAPGSTTSALQGSQACIVCHESSVWKSPGSGQLIVAEWTASTHNSETNGASCQDCHGSGHLHPESCNKCHAAGVAAVGPLENPDADDRCAKCHAKVNPRPGLFDGFRQLRYASIIRQYDSAATTAFTHFSTGRHGTYVSTNYKRNCRACHNPHNTAFGREQRQQWAESGHGDTMSGYRVSGTDFKTRGSVIAAEDNFGNFCVRCHTSTGYLNYISSGFSNVQALPDSGPNAQPTSNYPQYPNGSSTYSDKSRETIACNVCHEDARLDARVKSSYSGRVRRLPRIVSYYNYSSTGTSRLNPGGTNLTQKYKVPSTIGYANLPVSNFVTAGGKQLGVRYSDFGLSNVCVACHSGREIGMVIKVATVGNPDVNSQFPQQSLPLDFTRVQAVVNPHDRAAAANLTGISGFEFYADSAKYANPPPPAGRPARHEQLGLAPDYYGDPKRDGNGPCITCHVANNSKSHLFSPVDANDTIISTVCNDCHAAQPIDIPQQKKEFAAALAALRFTGFHIDSYNNDSAIIDTGYDKRYQLTLNSVYKIAGGATYSGITVQANAAVFSTGHSNAKWALFGRRLGAVIPAGWGGGTEMPAGAGDGNTLKDYIIFGSGNPFDHNATDAITAGAYTMGASFNYTLLSNDPGAFAHNPTYVKRLIYDSIDWLDNGQMDGSVVSSLTASLNALAASNFTVNPALYAVSDNAPKSVTFVLRSGSGTAGSPYTFSTFSFTADDLAHAISFLCGTTGVRP